MNCTTGEQKNRASPSNFENTEPFYQVYVNGEPTDYRVNRTGTGLNAFLPVYPSKRGEDFSSFFKNLAFCWSFKNKSFFQLKIIRIEYYG
jgi:hypothetical protein